MASSQKFKNPPLVEAVFEIKYDPIDNIGDVVADLSGRLKEFPDYEDLNIPPIPKEIPEAGGIVRYRFRSGDRAYLYQVGTGVITVNVVNYTTFDDFRQVIRQVLEQHQKTVPAKYIKRIGIRYVNKIKVGEKSPDSILQFGQTVPASFPKPIGWNNQLLFLNENKQLKIITSFTAETQEIVLDLDCFANGLMLYKLDDLLTWTDSAHQQIERCFLASLQEAFLTDIK